MRAHNEKVLSYLQAWLVGPQQAHRLLSPLLSPLASSGLLATLRAIGRAVRWNLAAMRGLVPLDLWPWPDLADEVKGEAFGREQARSTSTERATERQTWNPDRAWALRQIIHVQTASALLNVKEAVGQTPARERVPAPGSSSPAGYRSALGQPSFEEPEGGGGSVGGLDAEKKRPDVPQKEKVGAAARQGPRAEEMTWQKVPGSQPFAVQPARGRVDPVLAPLLAKGAEPAAQQGSLEDARVDPRQSAWRLGQELVLKETIRTQVSTLLASAESSLGLVRGQRGKSRQDTAAYSGAAFRARTESGQGVETAVRVGGMGETIQGQASLTQRASDPSFAPLADADSSPAGRVLVPRPQEQDETVQGAGTRPAPLRVPDDSESATKRGEAQHVLSRQLAHVGPVPRRLFSVQKRPDDDAVAASRRKVVLSQVSQVAAGVAPSVPEVRQSSGPGRASARSDGASVQPLSEEVTPRYGQQADAELSQSAVPVRDGLSVEIARQVEATMAQAAAGLASLEPDLGSAGLSADLFQKGESARDEMLFRPLAAHTMREIQRQVMAMTVQARLDGVSLTVEPGVRSPPGKQISELVEGRETTSVEILVQLVELVTELQRQVQQLAGAADHGDASLPFRVGESGSEGDPQALSRELARQLADEARRYGIRL